MYLSDNHKKIIVKFLKDIDTVFASQIVGNREMLNKGYRNLKL